MNDAFRTFIVLNASFTTFPQASQADEPSAHNRIRSKLS